MLFIFAFTLYTLECISLLFRGFSKPSIIYPGPRFKIHEGSWLSRAMVIAQEDGTCRDSKREYQKYLPANPLSITIVIAGNPHLVTIEFSLGPSSQDAIDEAKKITYERTIRREFEPTCWRLLRPKFYNFFVNRCKFYLFVLYICL
jgi:hypothetical protein